jgi:hypothetical protein
MKGIRYQIVPGGKGRGLGQNGGIVAAVSEQTGEELWVQKVYEIVYDDDLEGDKQDVAITGLKLSRWRNRLTVKNERGERYELDLATREVTRVD